jgi:endogenous inhibitor of DNA gyrase (YacG/DUF329 family)
MKHKTSTIKEGIEIQCKECGEKFRWHPNPYNTIKPKICPRCKRLKDFQKKMENQNLLSQSNLYRKNGRSQFKPGQYTPKNKKAGNKLKTPPKKKFYSSRAWRFFSRYVLITNTINNDGMTVQCCTCGKLMNINSSECHLGHYVKVFDGNSTNYATAFVIPNTGPQCVKCNRYHGGRQDIMAQWIEKKYGEGTVNQIMDMKRLCFKLDAYTLSETADLYEKKFKKFLEDNNLQNPWKKK